MANSNGTVSPPPDFNPFNQSLSLFMADGTEFEVTMIDLDYYRTYALRICINYATQIGASLMLLVVLLVLTRHEKRTAPVFILNAACLLINSIRSILQCLYYTGPFYNPYTYLSGDYSFVPASDKGISIAANTLTLMLVMLVMTSLVLQVRVMLITASKISRFWTMVVSISVAIIAVAFRFALVILNNKAIMHVDSFSDFLWFLNATLIAQAVSIWFFCLIFVVKLGFALSQRKKLGIQQLGPMQIIFIMGCQTMIIPAIFTALNYVYTVSEFASQTLTIVCLFLPLSAMWAGTAVDDRKIAVRGPDAHRKLLAASGPYSKPSGISNSKTTSTSDGTPSQTLPESPTSIYKSSEKGKGIHVETRFGVRDDEMV